MGCRTRRMNQMLQAHKHNSIVSHAPTKTKTLALLTVTDPFTTVVNITRSGRGTGPDIRKLKLTKRTAQCSESMSKKSDSEDSEIHLESWKFVFLCSNHPVDRRAVHPLLSPFLGPPGAHIASCSLP